jgi:hypothetical protein
MCRSRQSNASVLVSAKLARHHRERGMKRALLGLTILSLLTGPLRAQEISNAATTLPDGSTLISGKWAKKVGGSTIILFHHRFTDVDSIGIILTPNHTGAVVFVETVTRVEADRFQITSDNSAPDYVVNWLAVGK